MAFGIVGPEGDGAPARGDGLLVALVRGQCAGISKGSTRGVAL
jgi:hypothetical protein